jgi:hypothetical protein
VAYFKEGQQASPINVPLSAAEGHTLDELPAVLLDQPVQLELVLAVGGQAGAALDQGLQPFPA